jgi:hypothetical protein
MPVLVGTAARASDWKLKVTAGDLTWRQFEQHPSGALVAARLQVFRSEPKEGAVAKGAAWLFWAFSARSGGQRVRRGVQC